MRLSFFAALIMTSILILACSGSSMFSSIDEQNIYELGSVEVSLFGTVTPEGASPECLNCEDYGANFNTTTGIMTWTASCGRARTEPYEFDFRAYKQTGGEDATSVSVYVSALKVCSGEGSVQELSVYSEALFDGAMDFASPACVNCSGLSGVTFHNSNGVLQWTPSCGASVVSYHNFNFSCKTGAGEDVNLEYPVMVSSLGSCLSQNTNELNSITATLYTGDNSSGTASCTNCNQVSGASFNSTTGVLTWTTECMTGRNEPYVFGIRVPALTGETSVIPYTVYVDSITGCDEYLISIAFDNFNYSGSSISTGFVYSNVNNYYYRLDNANRLSIQKNPITQTLSMAGISDGNHNLYVWGENEDGTIKSTPVVQSFMLDATVPSLSVSGCDQYIGSNGITFTVSASDATSGLNKFQYTFDGSTVVADPTSSISFSSLSETWYTFTLMTNDNYGNMSNYNCTFANDITPPDVALDSCPGNINTTSFTAQANVNDGLTGAASYVYWIDDGLQSTVSSNNNLVSFGITLSGGWHSLYTYAVDQSGNQSNNNNCTMKVVLIDLPTNMPAITEGYNSNVTLEGDLENLNGQLANFNYVLEGTYPDWIALSDGELTFIISDNHNISRSNYTYSPSLSIRVTCQNTNHCHGYEKLFSKSIVVNNNSFAPTAVTIATNNNDLFAVGVQASLNETAATGSEASVNMNLSWLSLNNTKIASVNSAVVSLVSGVINEGTSNVLANVDVVAGFTNANIEIGATWPSYFTPGTEYCDYKSPYSGSCNVGTANVFSNTNIESTEGGSISARVSTDEGDSTDYKDTSSIETKFYKLTKVSNIQNAANDYSDYAGAGMLVYGSKLYFTGLDASGNSKLFVYDGTDITRVSDIVTGGNNDEPAYLTEFNNKLYFAGTNTNKYLFEYDGSSTIRAMYDSGDTIKVQYVTQDDAGDFFVFVGGDVASRTNNKLFVYVKLINRIYQVSNLYDGNNDFTTTGNRVIAMLNNNFYFGANDSSGNSRLFRYRFESPVAQTIYTMSGINGAGNDFNDTLLIYGDELYWGGYNTTPKKKIFTYTPASGNMNQYINIGDDNNDEGVPKAVVNNKLYFTGSSDSVNFKLYEYSESGGTVEQVTNIVGGGNDDIGDVVDFDGMPCFVADNSSGHAGVYCVDRRNSSSDYKALHLVDTNPGASDDPKHLTVYNNALYFFSKDSSGNYKLFRLE